MDSKNNPVDNKSATTKQKKLFAAIKGGDAETASRLLEVGVDVNFASPLQKGYVLMTPLMVACNLGLPVMVEKLVKAGALVDTVVDDSQCTALYYAVRSEKRESVLQIVEILLNHGADPNHLITDRPGSVFVASIRRGAFELVRLLLDKGGASIKAVAGGENTPLKEAANVGDVKIVNELIGRGADVNFQSKSGWCALMSASEQGEVGVVASLLENGANVNLQNAKNQTSLILASEKMADCFDEKRGAQYLQIVKQLVQAGANLNLKASNGWTALDFAEHNGLKGRAYYDQHWFGDGATYLREAGAKRRNELLEQH